MQFYLRDVEAVDVDASLLRLQEAEKRKRQRALTSASSANDTDALVARDRESQAFEDGWQIWRV